MALRYYIESIVLHSSLDEKPITVYTAQQALNKVNNNDDIEMMEVVFVENTSINSASQEPPDWFVEEVEGYDNIKEVLYKWTSI